jgi:hypothetical protein
MEYNKIIEKLNELYLSTDDNIIGVTYGYKTVNGKMTDDRSIIFAVKEKLPKDKISKENLLPESINIDGEIVLTDVEQRRYRRLGISDCDPSFYTWRVTPPDNRDDQRPLVGGVSCGNWDNMGLQYYEGVGYPMRDFVGTMGMLAIDNETNSLVGVTNNHVIVYDAFICSERTPIVGGDVSEVNNIKGDRVVQPNELLKTGPSYAIGNVKRYYPLREQEVNQIDVALLTLNDIDISNAESFHQLNLVDSTYPWASTAEINALDRDTILYSTGRTTGAKGEGITKLRWYEHGNISLTYNKQGDEVVVYFSDTIGFRASTDIPPATMSNFCYDPISGGDSGSALIADIGGTKKIIGLVFAGWDVDTGGGVYKTIQGSACRIDKIATLMNISAWNGESTNFSDTANTMEIAVDGLDDREYIDFNGDRYWQVGLRNKIL